MTFWWTAAFLTGLVGSLHCVGMCGPLALALPVGRFPRGQRNLARGLYHLGRLSAYSLLGAVTGSIGQGLVLTGLQRPISIGAGCLLVVWVISARFFPARVSSTFIVRQLTKPLNRLLRQPTLVHMAELGFLNGLLPCGSVYLALAGGIATSSALAGATYLLAFGVGTLPAMLSLSVFSGYLTPGLRQHFGRLMPVATVLIGLLLIGRGLGFSSHPAQTDAGAVPICHGGAKVLVERK